MATQVFAMCRLLRRQITKGWGLKTTNHHFRMSTSHTRLDLVYAHSLEDFNEGPCISYTFFLAKDAGGTHNFGWKSGSLQCSWTW
jgi:hypothetical protein